MRDNLRVYSVFAITKTFNLNKNNIKIFYLSGLTKMFCQANIDKNNSDKNNLQIF